ncbi:MAG TPA: hypothetical protein VHT49_01030 [Acidimicrobiales bacterium]|jgi:hypothetical protein|nr:hypothetical protein [Acidimicrobiales bacterium]
MNIEEFYSADERRRQSAEIELGTNWYDAAGSRYELSWVEDTGELYVMLERSSGAGSFTPFGDMEVESVPLDEVIVTVVGYIPAREELEKVLAGWEDEMAKPDGITWVANRLRENGVPTSAPAPAADPNPSPPS